MDPSPVHRFVQSVGRLYMILIDCLHCASLSEQSHFKVTLRLGMAVASILILQDNHFDYMVPDVDAV